MIDERKCNGLNWLGFLICACPDASEPKTKANRIIYTNKISKFSELKQNSILHIKRTQEISGKSHVTWNVSEKESKIKIFSLWTFEASKIKCKEHEKKSFQGCWWKKLLKMNNFPFILTR